MTKACEHCGVEFVMGRPWSRYCSRRCRVRGYRARQSELNRRWLQKRPDKVLEYKLKQLARDATPERQEYHRQKYWRNRERALERLRQLRRSADPVEREKRRLQKAQARRKAGVPERVRLTDEERRVKKRQREREREKRYSVRAHVAFELLRELGVEI